MTARVVPIWVALTVFVLGCVGGFWMGRENPCDKQESREEYIDARGSKAGPATATDVDMSDCAPPKSNQVSTIAFEQVSLHAPETGLDLRGDGSATLRYTVPGRMSKVVHVYDGTWVTRGNPMILELRLARAAEVRELLTDNAPARPEEAHRLPWHIKFGFRGPTELEWVSPDDSRFTGSRWRLVCFFRSDR